MKVKNLPKKIYLNICSNEDEVDYNELNGVTFIQKRLVLPIVIRKTFLT